jgi:hypothetical protein
MLFDILHCESQIYNPFGVLGVRLLDALPETGPLGQAVRQLLSEPQPLALPLLHILFQLRLAQFPHSGSHIFVSSKIVIIETAKWRGPVPRQTE